MKIEILVAVILVLIVFGWATWFRITTWWARRKYKPEKDKSKNAEEKRRQLAKDDERGSDVEDSEPGIANSDSPGSNEPERKRRVLQTTASKPIGKNRKGPRGIFRKRRRT